MESWTLDQAKPYLMVLACIVLLVTPFVKQTGNRIRTSSSKISITNVDASVLLCIIAYLVCLVFCVGKKIDIGIGSMDAYAYQENFNKATCSYNDFIQSVTTFEWGYSSIVWIVRQITKNYKALLVIWYTITFYFLIKFLCYTEQGGLTSIRVAFAALILLSQMNTLRMSVAIALSLNSLICTSERHWAKAMVFVLLATAIQVSSVILLPVVFIEMAVSSDKQKQSRRIIILLLLSFLLIYFSLPQLQTYVAGTDKRVYLGESSFSSGTYLAAGIAIIGAYVHRVSIIQNARLNRTLMIALPCIYLCVPLQLAISVMYRLTLYFTPVSITLLSGLAVDHHHETRTARVLWAALAVGYTAIQIVQFATVSSSYFGPYSNTLFLFN